MIISFAWTTPALMAGRKHKTRRSWPESYAKKFHAGQIVDGYDRSPRYGGKLARKIRLLKDPYQQPTEQMTEQDFEDEGFKWMEEQKMLMRGRSPREFFEEWKEAGELVWVVEFDPL